MELTELIISHVISDFPLVIGLALAYWWITPKMFILFLSEAGGDKIRQIVREEHASQSEEDLNKVKMLIKEHELVEEQKVQAALKMATADAHLVAGKLEQKLDGIAERIEQLENRVERLEQDE